LTFSRNGGILLHYTAAQLEKETGQIDFAVIRSNARKLTAFANKLSATNDASLKKHAQVILALVDDSQNT